MSQANPPPNPTRNGPAHEPAAVLEALPAEREESPANATTELELLRGENAALQAKVEDLEQLLGVASQDGDERWAERQREYESLLEEKSEVIRALHQKITELRERATGAQQPKVEEDSNEPVPERQELLKLKRELEEQRRQIGEDEESMMAQMRQMEMALAKDRAELARQRAELQRLHNELKREVESASRDAGLRERLGALQRRNGNVPTPTRVNQQDTTTPSPVPKTPSTKSGLFRRIFGSGE